MRSLELMIDEALRLGDVTASVERIKNELSQAIRLGEVALGEEFHRTLPDRYARRLLFRNSAPGYTGVVMTWGPGQRTAIHDHSGMWCVEGVVLGNMEVHQYDLLEHHGDRYRLAPTGLIHASVGSAGCLIPPYEYHVLANASEALSITLHIYGGEMEQCNTYQPRGDGWFDRHPKRLAYDN
ncbi:MAG: cysteine dioxygenase family protein [Acidobacteriia bacterium]|nr:cysteine dioxygenase family protein [Terriglobia bacterium]